MARKKLWNKGWVVNLETWLIVAGALNWGLTVLNFNLVSALADLVNMPGLATLIYSLVGIAGLSKLLRVLGVLK